MPTSETRLIHKCTLSHIMSCSVYYLNTCLSSSIVYPVNHKTGYSILFSAKAADINAKFL